MGLVGAALVEDKCGIFSVSTPSPVGVMAPGCLTMRFRDPGLDERDPERLELGTDADSESNGAEGWRGGKGLVSSSTAERCSIFGIGKVDRGESRAVKCSEMSPNSGTGRLSQVKFKNGVMVVSLN